VILSWLFTLEFNKVFLRARLWGLKCRDFSLTYVHSWTPRLKVGEQFHHRASGRVSLKRTPGRPPDSVTFMTAATPMRRQASGCCLVARTDAIRSPADPTWELKMGKSGDLELLSLAWHFGRAIPFMASDQVYLPSA
jgi:hypothetical protein